METSRDETYLRMLGDILLQQDIIGEILLAKGAVVLLDIHHREVSKDINTSFGPGEALREGAQILAGQEGLPSDWLKQVIERCFPECTPSDGATYPGLHIYVAPPGYLLTMFLLFGNQGDDEVMRELAMTSGLSTAAEMLSLVKAYLPEKDIPAQIQGKVAQLFAA